MKWYDIAATHLNPRVAVSCNELQSVAVICSELQCVISKCEYLDVLESAGAYLRFTQIRNFQCTTLITVYLLTTLFTM